MAREQLRDALGLRDDKHFRQSFLYPAVKAGLVEMTIPDKPRSSRQKHRRTAKGAAVARSAGSSPDRRT
ncbi:MAG: Fic family protein [Planctomycetota bacterium]